MSQSNRRDFFKFAALKLGALAIVAKSTGVMQSVLAAAAELRDAKINRNGYIHDATKAATNAATKAKYEAGAAKLKDKKPNCKNCNFYKDADKDVKGYGKCAMVGAAANTPGAPRVYEGGWCTVWAKNPKIS